MDKEELLLLQRKSKEKIFFTGILFLSVLFLIVSNKIWKNNRNQAVCAPVKTSSVYPFVAHMPAIQANNDEAKLYSFIERFVKNVYDERIINYHRPVELGRYSGAYLKDPLKQAMMMSDGMARADVSRLFINSNDVYNQLTKCSCGWVFNIIAIESISRTPGSSEIAVTVIGESVLMADKNKLNDVNDRFFGMKRIYLTIRQDHIRKTEDGEVLNEYGMYVTYFDDENVDPLERGVIHQVISQKNFLVE